MKLQEKITYVAGGGGAPACYIHIGILQELLYAKKDFIDYIGTSAGSIVGAFLACRQAKYGRVTSNDLDELMRMEFIGMKDLNLQGMGTFYLGKLFGYAPVNKLGIYKGENLHEYLCKLTYNMKFKDLTDDFNFYITATELLTGNLMIFSKSFTPEVYIADAVRASSSIQGAFIPFGIDADLCQMFINNSVKNYQNDTEYPEYSKTKILNNYGIKNNKKFYMIDGGNLGNCRTDLATNLGTEDDQIVGVSFTQTGTDIQPVKSNMDILGQTISIMMKGQETLAKAYTKLRDPSIILLQPDKLNVNTTDFKLSIEKKQELLDSGKAAIRPYL